MGFFYQIRKKLTYLNTGLLGWKVSTFYPYWQFKNMINKTEFFIKRFFYNNKKDFNDKLISINSFSGLLCGVIKIFLITGGIIFIAEEIEPYLKELLVNYKIKELFINNLHLNKDKLFDIYIGISGIIGTFLGLYFAAVSILAQSFYSKVQGEIRSLLEADKYGNFYIKQLVFLFSLSLFSLFLYMLGYKLGYLNFIIIAFLSFISLISFWQISLRIFNFFNPSILISHYILPEIVELILLVSDKRTMKFDKSIQNSMKNNVLEKIAVYKNINKFALSQEHLQTKSLKEFIQLGVYLLEFYEGNKSKIPLDSYWYPKDYEYKKYMESSYYETSIYIHAGRLISPMEIRNKFWFEKEVLKIFNPILKKIIQNQDLELYYIVIISIMNCIARIINQGRILEAHYLFENIYNPFKSDVKELTTNKKYIIALKDLYASMNTQFVISYANLIDILNIDNIRVDQVLKKDYIYNLNLPDCLLVELEGLRDRLFFERAVEGKIITASWYVKEYLYNIIIKDINYELDNLINIINVDIKQTQNNITKFPEFSIVDFYRLYECYYKLKNNIPRICNKTNSFLPVLKEEKLKNRDADLKNIKNNLINLLVEIVPFLKPPEKGMPDYFGQTYEVLYKYLSETLTEGNGGDELLFRKLFEALFSHGIKVNEDVRPKFIKEVTETPHNSYFTNLYADIFIDIFNFAGISIFLDDINNSNNRKIIDNIWNSISDKQSISKQIIAALSFKFNQFLVLSNRQHFRAELIYEISDILREKGLIKEYDYFERYDHKEVIKYPSDFIKAVCNSGAFTDHNEELGCELFILLYIWKDLEPEEQNILLANYKFKYLKEEIEKINEL